MKISLVIPSNRSDLASIGRILQSTDLDPTKFEVIVRDNSGCLKKRNILSSANSATLKYHCAPPCHMDENFSEALNISSGNYVLFLSDDDLIFPSGLTNLYKNLFQSTNNNCKIYIGSYLVTNKHSTRIYKYPKLDHDDPSVRVKSLIKPKAPNYIYYSVLEAQLARKLHHLQGQLPIYLSYTDQLITLLYACESKIFQSDDVFYAYDESEWDSFEKAVRKDRLFYEKAGLDPEIDTLHYLLQALEGALLLRSNFVRNITSCDMSEAAAEWFKYKYLVFLNQKRPVFNNSQTAIKCGELKQELVSSSSVNLNEILTHVTQIFSISNKSVALKFYDFWRSF